MGGASRLAATVAAAWLAAAWLAGRPFARAQRPRNTAGHHSGQSIFCQFLAGRFRAHLGLFENGGQKYRQ